MIIPILNIRQLIPRDINLSKVTQLAGGSLEELNTMFLTNVVFNVLKRYTSVLGLISFWWFYPNPALIAGTWKHDEDSFNHWSLYNPTLVHVGACTHIISEWQSTNVYVRKAVITGMHSLQNHPKMYKITPAHINESQQHRKEIPLMKTWQGFPNCMCF